MTNDVTREEMLARFYEMQESCERFKVTDNYDRKIELAIRTLIERSDDATGVIEATGPDQYSCPYCGKTLQLGKDAYESCPYCKGSFGFHQPQLVEPAPQDAPPESGSAKGEVLDLDRLSENQAVHVSVTGPIHKGPTVTEEEFENICDNMRCADILWDGDKQRAQSTYGDVARFVLEQVGLEVESA